MSIRGEHNRRKVLLVMKNNNHKKLFRMDKFGRNFYCKHARLNLVRDDKKQAKKKARQARKHLQREEAQS